MYFRTDMEIFFSRVIHTYIYMCVYYNSAFEELPLIEG